MTYDAIGNITSKTGLGSYGLGAQPARQAHAMVSASGLSFCYDRNGNMQSGGGWSYTWNADNTLASMTNGSAPESYSYDADGERVVRTAGGVTTVFFEGVWEQTTAGARKLYYTFNNQVVAMRDSTTNAVTYLHGDHLGSVSVATDSSGTSASTQEFDPWGQVRAGGIGATSLNYTGQRLDATGLLYYHARYYNPVLARFISADTIVPGAGALTVWPSDTTASPLFAQGPKDKDKKPTAPEDAQTLNRYSYVTNNPVRRTDPKGHCGGSYLSNLASVFDGSCLSMAVTIWKNTNPGTGEHTLASAYIGLSAVGLVYGALGTAGMALRGVAMVRAVQQVAQVAGTGGMLTIGRLADTAAARAQGANVLPERPYTQAANGAWIQAAIKAAVDFRTVSELIPENLRRAGGDTGFGSEVRQLLNAGYEIVDDLLVHPNAYLK